MVYLFYILLSSPLWYWVYLGFSDQLGAEPIVTLSVQSGYVTLSLLIINLWLGVGISLIGAKVKTLTWFYKRRRSLGLASSLFAVLHFLTYLGKESFEYKAWEQIVTKIYLTVAFLALIILVLLAFTSNNFSVRKLKFKKWKFLHRFVHLAFFLVLTHVLLIEKGNTPLLLVMMVPLIPFQGYRLLKNIAGAKKAA